MTTTPQTNQSRIAHVKARLAPGWGPEKRPNEAILCSLTGTTMTTDGEAVPVYNPGPPVAGPAFVRIEMAGGGWCLSDVLSCRNTLEVVG